MGFRDILNREGLHRALGFLNARVEYRYTGVYCFDGPLLRNVCLYDRESQLLQRGADAPVVQTYCGITGSAGDCIAVENVQVDPRFPWMQGSCVIAYCGVPVFDPHKDALGTLCHFDLQPRRMPAAELPTVRAAAAQLWTYCIPAGHGPG